MLNNFSNSGIYYEVYWSYIKDKQVKYYIISNQRDNKTMDKIQNFLSLEVFIKRFQ